MPDPSAKEEVCSETELSAEEVRRLADLVVWGECITFPNGLVVDKRPVSYPAPVWTPMPNVSPAVPTHPQWPGPYYSGGSGGQVSPMTDPYEAARQARTASDG